MLASGSHKISSATNLSKLEYSANNCSLCSSQADRISIVRKGEVENNIAQHAEETPSFKGAEFQPQEELIVKR